MPYRVTEPEVQVLLKIGEIFEADGKHVAYEHASQIFFKDEVVEDDATKAKDAGQLGPISPDVVKEYEDGDPHLRAVLEKVVASTPAKRGRQAKSDSGAESE